MARHIVKCRLCNQQFDTEEEEAILVGQKSYYHRSCYENWIKNRTNTNTVGDDDFWKESTIDFLYRDVKVSIDFVKFKSQWESFTNPDKKMTPKGIYFTVRYFYTIQHGNPDKAVGGIGIVPFIYKESCEYWTNLEMRRRGTIDAIIEQIKARQARPVQTITKKEIKKEKVKWDLDNV